jgi:hypothetical protein
MADTGSADEPLILSPGTQVVVQRDVAGQSGQMLHPRGAVGIIVRAPEDVQHFYRVRFPDGVEESLRREEIVTLSRFQEPGGSRTAGRADLFDRVIFRCIIGSRAYGLESEESDTDYRGVFLPPADRHWSLYGVPDQIDRPENQEQYWELQRFLVLALKANPNVLECLYTPLVDKATPLAEELLGMRAAFLSRLVYQTYNGYVLSQFRRMQADLRNHGQIKTKHVMHLIRLLIAGIGVLRHGTLPVRVEAEHRDQLLAIRRGEVDWSETESWRLKLHAEFDAALRQSPLPERPDYASANAFLIKARRLATHEALP